MTPEVPDPERMMPTNRRSYTRETENSTRIGAVHVPSVWVVTVGTHVDLTVCEEHPVEKERRINTERMLAVIQGIVDIALPGITRLGEVACTTFVTREGLRRIIVTDNWLHAMLHDVYNETNDDKLKYIEIESDLLRKVEEVKFLHEQVTQLTKAMLSNLYLTAPVASISRKKLRKT